MYSTTRFILQHNEHEGIKSTGCSHFYCKEIMTIYFFDGFFFPPPLIAPLRTNHLSDTWDESGVEGAAEGKRYHSTLLRRKRIEGGE